MTPTPTPSAQFSSNSFRLSRQSRHTRPPAQQTPVPLFSSYNGRPSHGALHLPSHPPVTPLSDDTNGQDGGGRTDEELSAGGAQTDDEENSGDPDGNEDGEEDIDHEDEGDEDGEDGEDEDGIEAVSPETEVPFNPIALGLKEIGNLASWTVSSCKPGCGVEALRDEDTLSFWQSDGPQPHHLNIHFSRLVSILRIRLYLDFVADESYTPTRISFLAGTGYHDLITFSELDLTKPRGWTNVPLDNVGGGKIASLVRSEDRRLRRISGRDKDMNVLRCFLLQVKVIENHQNGKDTHIRGLKVYARDERIGRVATGLKKDRSKDVNGEDAVLTVGHGVGMGGERTWLTEPEWMRDPELR